MLQDFAAKKNTASHMSPLARKKRNAPIPARLSHLDLLSFCSIYGIKHEHSNFSSHWQ